MAIEKCSVFLCGMRAQPNTKLCLGHSLTTVVASDPPPVIYKVTDMETPIEMDFKTIDDYSEDEAEAMIRVADWLKMEMVKELGLEEASPIEDYDTYLTRRQVTESEITVNEYLRFVGLPQSEHYWEMPSLWQDEGDQA